MVLLKGLEREDISRADAELRGLLNRPMGYSVSLAAGHSQHYPAPAADP